MLTLRQIEVVRAIMLTGTVVGAAKLLNVSMPGVSRLMKYTEKSLGIRLFDRRHGRYVPTLEAQEVFDQLDDIYKKVEDLQFTVKRLQIGQGSEFRIGSVPSIANIMIPKAVEKLRKKHPNLAFDINTLKVEEMVDHLLLEKIEVAALSHRLDHPKIDLIPLTQGRLFCITPEGHPLASRGSVSAAEIAAYPLIGVDSNDPYGKIMADVFIRHGLTYQMEIKARFGTTVCRLVQAGLGVAVIDQFTVAHDAVPGIRLLEIEEPTPFQTYVALKSSRGLSIFAENFITILRQQMESLTEPKP